MKRALFTACVFQVLAGLTYAQIDYSTQVQPIFDTNCGQCHGGTSGVTVTSYSATLSSVGTQYGTLIVVPGDTGASPLWDKINPDPEYGGRMPLGGSLSQDNIHRIGQWIVEGAKETPTAVSPDSEQPGKYGLTGCYPNPFNPSTTIQFALFDPSLVTFTLYDLKGRPVHEHQSYYSSGTHEVTLMLSHLASGMYVVRMRGVSGTNQLPSYAMKIVMAR